jgi:hypothetical protein
MTRKNGNHCFTIGTDRRKREGRGEESRFSMSLKTLQQKKGAKTGDWQ